MSWMQCSCGPPGKAAGCVEGATHGDHAHPVPVGGALGVVGDWAVAGKPVALGSVGVAEVVTEGMCPGKVS